MEGFAALTLDVDEMSIAMNGVIDHDRRRSMMDSVPRWRSTVSPARKRYSFE